jgi:hypothetical protein
VSFSHREFLTGAVGGWFNPSWVPIDRPGNCKQQPMFHIIHMMSKGCYDLYQSERQPGWSSSLPRCHSTREIEQECARTCPYRG